MTKKSMNKLLSVVLALAICFTTVLGCLITAGAADTNCCAKWSVGSASKDLDKATIYLAFTAVDEVAAEGFSAIEFALDGDADLDLHSINVVATADGFASTTMIDGSAVDVNDLAIEISSDKSGVIAESQNAKAYASVVLELTYGFAGGYATQGQTYAVSVSDVTLAGAFATHVCTSGAVSSTIKASCEHVITVIGDPIAVDEANNYSTYAKSVCTLCGEEFGYQLVPTADVSEDSGSTITWSAEGAYDDTLADNDETGTEANPIIIDSVEELYSLAMRTKWKDSLNKYYKLADGISKVVLQSEAVASAVMALNGADEVKTYFDANGGYVWGTSFTSPYAFAGHFDGNGATFYGLYAKNKEVAGLFPIVYHTDYDVDADAIAANNNAAVLSDGYVGVSNVNITNSYLYGEVRMGFIAGSGINTNSASATTTEITGLYADWCLWIDGCSVYGNYMYSSKNGADAVNTNGLVAGNFGAFYGAPSYSYSGARCVYTKNCLVYGNSNETKYTEGGDTFAGIGLTGNFGRGGYDNTKNTVLFENLIVLDATPYLTTGNGKNSHSSHASTTTRFKNVYTNAPTTATYSGDKVYQYTSEQVIAITADGVKGSAAITSCPKLAWGSTWIAGENDSLPFIAAPNYVSDTIYWDGDVATGIAKGTGEKNDPYIINTVAELAWLVKEADGKQNGDANPTLGKYYKVADGIKNIVLQPYAYGADILALDSAVATKAYFEQNAASMKKWVNEGWEQGSFCGTFDGNGATIYGMYQNHDYNAGLFSTVDAGTTIKNIAIKNAYLIVNKCVDQSKASGYTDYQMSAIFAVTSSSNYGAQSFGICLISNCEVSNCYMRQNTSVESGWDSRAGILVGNAQQDVVAVENCLVYGNDATYGQTVEQKVKMPLMGCSAHSNGGNTGLVPEGYTPVENGGHFASTVHNSIVLGCDVMNVALGQSYRRNAPGVSFKNIYTDGVSGTVTFPNGSTFTYPENEIKEITYAQATGADAETNLSGLAWGDAWYCGAYGEIPVLASFAVKGTNTESTAAHQLYGSSVTYNDDGTLDFNLHFVPQYAGIEATLYVGTLDGSKFYKLTATESSYREDLGDTALMFTLPNISARDIEKVWLPTVVVDGGLNTEWGLTQPIALADNSKAILAGDYDAADKQVAAALINYGITAEEALTTPSTEKEEVATKIVYAPNNAIDATFMTEAAEGVGDTEDNPYIISTYGHWRHLVEKATYEDTYGKYFKVDPTIKIFVFQSESFINKVGGLDAFLALDAQGVADIFENAELSKNIMRHNNGGNFAGTLDGSGVQIVGMSGVYYKDGVMQKGTGGLFGKILEDATVKNLTISHTYNNTGDLNGVLIGYVAKQNAASDNVREIKIENIVLHDNYQVTTGNGLARSGLLIGRVDPAYITIRLNGILTYDNKALGQRSNDTSVEGYSDMLDCALVGSYSSGWNGKNQGTVNGEYKNIITLGNAPYPVASQANQGTKPEYWSNVYTDTVASFTPCTQTNYPSIYPAAQWSSYDITLIDAGENNANVKNGGAVALCPKIDWTREWIAVTDNGYPAPIQNGHTIETVGKTIYWDGTVATDFEGGSGTKSDPFVIATAAQLAYFMKDYTKSKDDSFTAGSYYKIADGIDKIVLQEAAYANDILALNSAAEVKAYFEANAANMHSWVNEGWEQGSFYGTFDGNGVEVYGLYSNTNLNAGLFNTIDAGAVIKNISVINSYMKSSKVWNANNSKYDSYQVGAIAPVVGNSSSYGAAKMGIVWIDGCKVINNYMTHDTEDQNRCGVILGSANGDVAYITNCITYGNDATYNNGVKMPLIADFTNSLKVENATAPEGLTLVKRSDNSAYVANGIHNSITLGCMPYNDLYFPSTTGGRNTSEVFQNVYTNLENSSAYINNVLDIDELKGDKATNVVNTFNTANGKTVWYVGAIGEYPGFKPAGNVPSQYQAGINNVVFATADTVGADVEYNAAGNMVYGVYQTALSLKANPYMSFAFAFGNEYKENRDKIKVRFTYTQDGALTTSDEIAVPAYTGEDIKNVDGWTNTTANGRFHTYKAECIPVEALAYGIEVKVSYDGGEWKDFGTYSVEGLGLQFDSLSKTQPGDYYATRVDAAKALLFYAQAIAARYGA